MRVRPLIGRLLMVFLLPAAILWLAQRPGLVQQLDAAIYDRMLRFAAHAPAPDILIIAIDERSLRELGRWPWPRTVHARLLEQLAPAQPGAVLLDVFLTEPSADPREDDHLARAMTRLPVYLPVLYTASATPLSADDAGFLPPLPKFAGVARGLGHDNLALDADGVSRVLYLREGLAGQLQPYVGALIAGRTPPPALALTAAARPADAWLRQAPLRLSFAGPRGSYSTVSYVGALRGEVPADALRGKRILIGATAPGLGDQVATPSAAGAGVLPGVEVHANAIDTLEHGHEVAVLQTWIYAAWVVLPLWLALWLLIRLPRHALLVSGLMVLASLAISVGAMALYRRWLPPAAPALGLLALYLLWSWYWLESQFHYLRQRAQALGAVPAGAFEQMPALAPAAADAAALPTQALDHAIARLRRMQTLMDEALHRMPVAVLICDDEGRIGSSNAAAARLLEGASGAAGSVDGALDGRLLPELLHTLAPATAAADAGSGGHWSSVLRREHVTRAGRVFLFEAAAFGGGAPGERGWVVVLPDLTAEREAQRQREEWRRFLSHDLRSPQVTILSLLAMHESGGGDTAVLLRALRREAERTLALAEGFMDVAEAESDDYHFEATHLASVLLDARDQVWPYAQASGVRIEALLGAADDLLIPADGALLARAIVNLLNNAVRHSPRGGAVELCLAVDEAAGQVCIAVADQGSGMDEERLQALLPTAPGRQASAPPRPAPASSDEMAAPARRMGLGFSVVRAVVQRHGGAIDGASAPGAGTTFWLLLPMSGPATRRETRMP